MKGSTKTEARKAAERNIPLGIKNRPDRVSAYVDGYMAGHAAHTRKLNKILLQRGYAHSAINERGTNMIDLEKAFEAADDEYIKFGRIEKPLHPRPDICAFIKLHELVPGEARDMVCAAEHDEIYLDVDCEKLAEVATQEDIVYLTRCGVRFDSSTDSLAMFV